jgi:hypothetical protein
MSLIRISLVKEPDKNTKEAVAEELARVLGVAREDAESFSIPNPSRIQIEDLKQQCRKAGNTVKESQGRIPSIELVQQHGGRELAIWSYR